MNKKILGIIIAVILIAVVGIVAYTVITPIEASMKNETFENMTVSVPADANFTKSSYGNYEDNKLGIQITPVEGAFGVVAFVGGLDGRKDLNRISPEGLPNDAIAWKSDEGWTQIFITDNKTGQGICVGAKDQQLAIQMAKTVVFGSSYDKVAKKNKKSSDTNNYIGEDKALEIASQTPMGGDGAKATLTKFQGKPMYKVTWPDGNFLYVDAVKGTIYDKYGSSG